MALQSQESLVKAYQALQDRDKEGCERLAIEGMEQLQTRYVLIPVSNQPIFEIQFEQCAENPAS